jgi:hypothetical protein
MIFPSQRRRQPQTDPLRGGSSCCCILRKAKGTLLLSVTAVLVIQQPGRQILSIQADFFGMPSAIAE